MSDNSSPPSSPTPTYSGSVLYGNSLPGPEQARAIMDRGKVRDTPSPQPSDSEPSRTALAAAFYPPSKTEADKPPPSPSPSNPPSNPTVTEAKPGQAETAEGVPAGADPALWSEFGEAAKALRIDKAGADKLVALHTKAMAAQVAAHSKTTTEWRAATEAAYSPEALAGFKAEFDARLGNDADAQEFRRLLNWSGIGNNVSALRAMARLMRGR